MDVYIKRRDVLSLIKKGYLVGNGNYQSVKNYINSIPAADVVERKTGKWEEIEITRLADIEDQPDAIASMFCPECKRFANHIYHYGNPTNGMNFCPNCGADMRPEPPKEE